MKAASKKLFQTMFKYDIVSVEVNTGDKIQDYLAWMNSLSPRQIAKLRRDAIKEYPDMEPVEI